MQSFNPRASVDQLWADSSSRTWFNRTFSTLNPGSVRGSIFTLIASSFGASMLSLPWNFAQNGLVLGLFLIFLAAIVCFVTLDCLTKICCREKTSSYVEIVGIIFGNVSLPKK